MDALEGKVFKDMLEQALREFEGFHIGAQRTIAFQQMQYFLDFAQFTAALISIRSNSFSILDNLRIQLQGEIHHHKLAAQGKLPVQIAAQRLKALDDVEARLKGTR